MVVCSLVESWDSNKIWHLLWNLLVWMDLRCVVAGLRRALNEVAPTEDDGPSDTVRSAYVCVGLTKAYERRKSTFLLCKNWAMVG